MRLSATAAAPLTVTRRMIAGTITRYGEVGFVEVTYEDGTKGAEALRVRAGALTFPDDLAAVPLTLEHGAEERGRLALVDDTPERLYVALAVDDGPAGDAALAEALDRSPGGRAALSFSLEDVDLEGDEIVAATVVAIGQVHEPGFNSARIDLVAASQGTPTNGGTMSPEQIARLAALRAQESRTDAEQTELDQLAALEAPAGEPATPAAPAAAAPSPATTAPPAAVAASVPAVPGGIPAPAGAARTTPVGGHFQAMVNRVVDEWRRSNLATAITAALSDIVESSNDVIEAPAWSGELWSGLKYEPVWSDLFSTGSLTSWKGEGWRFTSKLEMADYAGDKVAIPSDTVTTEASAYEAARMALGVDIDRKFYDFPNQGFVNSLFEQLRESWTEKLDGKVRAYAVANAVAATRTVVVSTANADATVEAPNGSFTAADVGRAVSGAGIPAATTVLSVTDSGTIELSANATATASGVTMTIASADTSLLKVVGRLVQSGRSTKLGRLTGVVMNSDDAFELLNITNDDVPKWLNLWHIAPEDFRMDDGIARGTVYGVVKQAATLRTLPGSPIRVSAQNIANGGVDEAAFGYWAIEEHHPAGILKATFTPAAA